MAAVAGVGVTSTITTIFTIIREICTHVNEVQYNTKACQNLYEQIQNLEPLLEKLQQKGEYQISEELTKALLKLQNTLERVVREVQKYTTDDCFDERCCVVQHKYKYKRLKKQIRSAGKTLRLALTRASLREAEGGCISVFYSHQVQEEAVAARTELWKGRQTRATEDSGAPPSPILTSAAAGPGIPAYNTAAIEMDAGIQNGMTANALLRSNKTKLQDILRSESGHVIQCVFEHEDNLLVQFEYDRLKDISESDRGEAITKLVDKIMSKGEPQCQAFLSLLRDPKLTDLFPDLKTMPWYYNPPPQCRF